MDSERIASDADKREERRDWIWIMLLVNIVFILILMTVGIVALRVGNYLPEGTDILFLVGKSPSVDVGESQDKVWESGKNVSIFKTSYENGKGAVTVASQNGDSLIAPGVETIYKFTMYNSGNMAIVYETDLDFNLRIGDKNQKNYTFPLLVRLCTQDGEYLIGNETEWVNVENAVLSQHIRTLGANSYETFELHLMWQFEGGDDELDTLYGNDSASYGVNLTMGIDTYAEQHPDATATGGTLIDPDAKTEVGGEFRIIWFIILMVNIAILIFYVSWLLNKRLRKW